MGLMVLLKREAVQPFLLGTHYPGWSTLRCFSSHVVSVRCWEYSDGLSIKYGYILSSTFQFAIGAFFFYRLMQNSPAINTAPLNNMRTGKLLNKYNFINWDSNPNLHTYGAEPFLRSCQLCSSSRLGSQHNIIIFQTLGMPLMRLNCPAFYS
jgi:hypothetical protein